MLTAVYKIGQIKVVYQKLDAPIIGHQIILKNLRTYLMDYIRFTIHSLNVCLCHLALMWH